MRKQIFAGLIAAVALLFSVVALTTAPASGENYSDYGAQTGKVDSTDPVVAGSTITGNVTGCAPCTVSITTSAGVVTTTADADGNYSITLPAGVTGDVTIMVGDAIIGTATVAGASTTTTTGTTGTTTTGTTTTGTTGTTTTTGTTGTTGVVTTAVDFGFNGNGIPNNPSIAVTGTDSDVLGFIATGLIALGAVAMGSRRKFLQGALED